MQRKDVRVTRMNFQSISIQQSKKQKQTSDYDD